MANKMIDEERLAAYHDELMKTHLVGGVVFDISAYKATGTPPVPAKYADLAAALGTNGANVPESMRKGGMSVKFIQSSDNKYQQFRCIVDEFTTDVTKWAIADEGVYVENPEFIEVKTDSEGKILEGITPEGVKQFNLPVNAPSVIIDNSSSISNIENPEYLEVITDSKDKVLEGIQKDGTKIVNGDLLVNGKIRNRQLQENISSIKKDVDELIDENLLDFHNYYPNALSKASGFVRKYLNGEDVTIVLLGDSITQVSNQKHNENTNQLPPFMERQNWCYWLWKYLNKSDNMICRRSDYPGFFTLTGDYHFVQSGQTDYDSNNTFNEIYSTSVDAAFQFNWNLSEYEKTNLVIPLAEWSTDSTKIEVIKNGNPTNGLVQYYNGTDWVEANNAVLNFKLPKVDGQLLDGYTLGCRCKRTKLRGVSTGNVSIKVSKNSNDGTRFIFWGVEQWNGQGVFIANAAYGGYETYRLRPGNLSNIMGHNPDLVLFELTLINNYGERKSESNSKELMYNDFYDYIWGDRVGHEDTLALKNISDGWSKFQTLLIVPHWRKQWVDGNLFRNTIEDSPVAYNALDCYNVVKGLIEEKGDLEYINIGAEMKREAFKRGLTLEQSYDGNSNTMNSDECFTQDTVHLNNLGSKIYAKYIAPIFDF